MKPLGSRSWRRRHPALTDDSSGSRTHLRQGKDATEKIHAHVSGTIHNTLLALAGFSFFAALTVMGTTDSELIANSATIDVPFAGAKVSFAGFLFVGPLVLLGLTTYLHIFVSHWQKLGGRLGEPFLFNLPSWSSRLLTLFLFYWLTPALMILFMWKALPRGGSRLLIVATGLTLGASLWLQSRIAPKRYLPSILRIASIVIPFWILLSMNTVSRPVNLSYTDLSNQDLSFTRLPHAQARGTVFRNSIIRGALLDSADLRKADLRNVFGRAVRLNGANISSADLSGADLSFARLKGADISHTYLTRANMKSTDLRKANLRASDLNSTDLSFAYLNDAFLTSANMTGTLLYSSDLTGARVTQTQIDKACLNDRTILPSHIQRPSANPANCPAPRYPDFSLSRP